MWDEAVAALERAEHRHRRFFALLSASHAPQPAWEPPADVFESVDGFRIFVALPGIGPEHVRLAIDEAGLVVRSERPPPSALQCLRVRRMEIPYGTFERRIDLPPGRYTLREQQMTDGCLELYLTRE
jgi:HSP20 family molecular chaperone IbpA